jgi:hypothetical protein
LFFSCCDSVLADFKHAATRQHVVPQAQASCLNLRRKHREATAAGIGLGTTTMYIQRTTSGAAGNGLHTTIKYMSKLRTPLWGTSLSSRVPTCYYNEKYIYETQRKS